jgi:integrase
VFSALVIILTGSLPFFAFTNNERPNNFRYRSLSEVKIRGVIVYFEKYLQSSKQMNIDEAVLRLRTNKLDIYQMVEDFVNFMIEDLGKSLNTAKVSLKPVKSLLRSERIQIDPKMIAESASIPRQFRDEEYPLDKVIVSKILQSVKVRRLRVFLFCLASSGCRVGELSAITWKDINFNSTPVSIHLRPETTKTRNGRTVYISDEAVEELKQWRCFKSKEGTAEIDPDGLVFKTHMNLRKLEAVSPKHITNKMQMGLSSLLKSLKLDEVKPTKEDYKRHKITLHSFRRFFKTQVSLEAGQPDLAEYLICHRSLSQTYFKVTPSKVANIYLEKCMEHLTFCDTASLEKSRNEIVSKLAEKDLVIASTKQQMDMMKQQLKQQSEQMNQIMSMIQHNPSLAQVKPEILTKKL